ncbi:hypothetical protein Tco_0683967 [Tanacetum coccineum]
MLRFDERLVSILFSVLLAVPLVSTFNGTWTMVMKLALVAECFILLSLESRSDGSTLLGHHLIVPSKIIA